MKLRVWILFLCIATSAGCFRTEYINLTPPPGAPPAAERHPQSAWQHFFVWGLFPDEERIDAAAICGGADQVAEIKTEQTFLQGLVEALATPYINIYSPWNGEVVCKPSER